MTTAAPPRRTGSPTTWADGGRPTTGPPSLTRSPSASTSWLWRRPTTPGLCAADTETRRRFNRDLDNLTLASEALNDRKGARDAADWSPEHNRCWFAGRVLAVKLEYGLTVDPREAAALDSMLEGCRIEHMLRPYRPEPSPSHGAGILPAAAMPACLPRCYGADLASADLTGANLRRVDLRDANLAGADLTDADLLYAKMSGADLRGADLTGADLASASLLDADLRDANLAGAVNLARADLGGANLGGANLAGVDLRSAILYRVDLTGANLTGANLAGVVGAVVNLTGANLTGANLTGAALRNSDLTGANLRDATVDRAILAGADLTDADLTGATGRYRGPVIGCDRTGLLPGCDRR